MISEPEPEPTPTLKAELINACILKHIKYQDVLVLTKWLNCADAPLPRNRVTKRDLLLYYLSKEPPNLARTEGGFTDITRIIMLLDTLTEDEQKWILDYRT